MNLFRDVKEKLCENNLKIIYMENKLNIVNYKSVVGFDSNKIVVDCGDLVIVSGTDLVISKLLLDELLISGKIEKVEFRWIYEKWVFL